MKKWIRLPDAGRLRGTGSWQQVRGDAMEADYEKSKVNGYLPVAWEISDGGRVEPCLAQGVVVHNGAMTHQFHLVAVPVSSKSDAHVAAAREQLKHLIETVLVVEGEV